MFIPFSLFITIPILHGVVRVLPHYFIIHCKNVLKEENRKKEKNEIKKNDSKRTYLLMSLFDLDTELQTETEQLQPFFVHHTCEIAYKTHVY